MLSKEQEEVEMSRQFSISLRISLQAQRHSPQKSRRKSWMIRDDLVDLETAEKDEGSIAKISSDTAEN